MKRRGHIGRKRPHNALSASSKRNLKTIYLTETNKLLPEIYAHDRSSHQAGSGFKWLVSTCIAAIVGVGAIGMAMYASMDIKGEGGVLNTLQKVSLDGMKPVKKATIVNDRLRIAKGKQDRLIITSYGLSTKYIIHERTAQKKGNRDFISIKPYTKIVTSLSTAQPKNTKNITPFNPFKLYANTTPLNSRNARSTGKSKNVTIRVIELTSVMLTNEDQQKLSHQEIEKFVAETADIYNQSISALKVADTKLDQEDTKSQKHNKLLRTTTLQKNAEDDQIPEQREFHKVRIKRGNSILALIRDAGAQSWQAAAISKAMNSVFPVKKVQAGQELRFILVPTPHDNGKVEPLSVSLFSGKTHKVTVARSSAGEYVASKKPVDLTVIGKTPAKKFPSRSTIYTSLFHAALMQNIPKPEIMKILRVHSYDVDFKRRVQTGDGFEVFYDHTEDASKSLIKELLYTSITISGVTKRFYRYRTPDGAVDYYDQNGSSSKKFLMRKPVRGARFSSSYGFRMHPILKVRKMHKGIDWAAPTGTPILAAGNGIVEEVKYNGGYGRYVRIRHANSHKTAYAHMHRWAKGLKKGLKVRQGQVIGYVGSTGRSSGPHLHFEVLVNNRHVNPMKIDVPRGRQLKGRILADFQKARERIDNLMRQTPVKTRVAKYEDQS